MKSYCCSLGLALLFMTSMVLDAPGQGLLIDDVFDYPTGLLEATSGDVWDSFDSFGDLIDVVQGSIDYTGYGTTQGNKIMLKGEGFSLVARRFGTQASGTVYAAALVHITEGLATGFDRFLAFNVHDRVVNLGILGDGSSGNAFRLCLNGSFDNTCSGALMPGAYLLVVSYTFNPGTNDDVARLWINPDLSLAEPAADEEVAVGVDITAITEVVIEQNDALPPTELDELRVATSWEALSGNGNIAPNQPIVSEPDNAIFTISGDPGRLFVASWSNTTDPDGDTVTYTWQVSADDFSTFLINADTDSDTRYEITYGELAALIDAAGFNLNEEMAFSHRVLASDGQATSASVTHTFSLIRSTLTATEQEEVPGAFTLSPIYPNPFNPDARFTLTVAQTQAVRLALYDITGREVAVLHEGVLASGATHGFALQGHNLPSGLYMIRAESEIFSDVQSVILAK